MKAIIVDGGPLGGGLPDHSYHLIAEDGEVLCSHVCSSPRYAPHDLYKNRPERQEMFDAKGITEFVWLADSGLEEAELLRRNREWAGTTDKAVEE